MNGAIILGRIKAPELQFLEVANYSGAAERQSASDTPKIGWRRKLEEALSPGEVETQRRRAPDKSRSTGLCIRTLVGSRGTGWLCGPSHASSLKTSPGSPLWKPFFPLRL